MSEAARDVIARAAFKGRTIARHCDDMDLSDVDWDEWWRSSADMPLSGPGFLKEWYSVADEISTALTAAGYRILAPGELDRHICGYPEMGSYKGQVILVAPDWLKRRWPNGIGIDVCLALEIQALWHQGIKTTGHCCGHGRAPAFISVWPDEIDRMKALGYQTLAHPDGRGDHFVPKTQVRGTPGQLDDMSLEAAAKVADGSNSGFVALDAERNGIAAAIRNLKEKPDAR